MANITLATAGWVAAVLVVVIVIFARFPSRGSSLNGLLFGLLLVVAGIFLLLFWDLLQKAEGRQPDFLLYFAWIFMFMGLAIGTISFFKGK